MTLLGSKHAKQKSVGIMQRLNIFTAIAGGIILSYITWKSANMYLPGEDSPSRNNFAITLALFGWSIGFMIGIGAFVGPFRWIFGKDLNQDEVHFLAGKDQGISRYFRFTTDHKVVGIQYLVITMILFGVAGIMAMIIRTNLASANSQIVNASAYNNLVGSHGITMIIATIIMVTGPFGNFILPIMIGARDMAFPRLNALSFWLIAAAVPVLLSGFFLGGITTGWTAYAPLSSQSAPGMNAYAVTIIVFAVSSAVAGANITTTTLKMRTKGMTWNRTPIFVYGAVVSVALAIPAFPMFMASQIFSLMDRGIGTTFYNATGGGSAWLYSNLFWLMGHPEVYVILLPAIGALMEITTVFARKPLFSFRAAVMGMAGIAGLSVLVWAHHMFAAGWAPALDGPFMVTTELISIPTGLLFLVVLGTLWRGRIWLKLPMMAVYAMLWNFMIGGVTGIYLSDVPADLQLHGNMFVTAHFHYTLMGAGLTGALGAVAFWFPKITGKYLDDKFAIPGFLVAQAGFNITFLGMFSVGLAGMPRRVADYSIQFEFGNQIATIGAYTIFFGMLLFTYAMIASWKNGKKAPINPWNSQTLEWTVPNPIPLENFGELPVVKSDPYQYGERR